MRLLIRGMDEHAIDRGGGSQLQGRGRSNALGQAVRILVPSSGLHPDLGGPRSRSCRAAIAARLDHRHHLLRRLQRAVLSHRATGPGLCGRSQRGASVAAQTEARRASGVFRLCRVLAVLRRSRLRRQFAALPRAAVADAGRRRARLLGQAQHHRPSPPRLFHRRVLPPRHARPFHRPRAPAGEIGPDRSHGALDRQAE